MKSTNISVPMPAASDLIAPKAILILRILETSAGLFPREFVNATVAILPSAVLARFVKTTFCAACGRARK